MREFATVYQRHVDRVTKAMNKRLREFNKKVKPKIEAKYNMKVSKQDTGRVGGLR